MTSQGFHKCIEKKSILVTDENTGEIFCSSCGEVIRERLVDMGNEVRMYSKEQYLGKTRAGTPSKIYLFDMGNSTTINRQDKDSTGKFIPQKNKLHFSCF